MKSFIVILSILLFSGGWAQAATQSSHVKAGNALFHQGRFAESLQKYEEALKKPSHSDIINFNMGAALYKKGQYAQTIQRLQEALLTEDKILKEKTYYNLGNTYYKSGIAQEETNLGGAIHALEESLRQYEKTLAVNEKDEDAKFNHEFVTHELERLKKKQQDLQKQKQKQTSSAEQSKDSKENQQQNKDQSASPDPTQNQAAGSPADQQQNSQQFSSQKQPGGEEAEPEKNETAQAPELGKEDTESSQQTTAGSTIPQTTQAMTSEEAKMLLESYQQNDEPKGLLNFVPYSWGEQPVPKDW